MNVGIEKLRELAFDINVLYVEDNEIAREKTTKILKRIFENIDVAIHGRDGLTKFMQKNHDLVISDIIMGVIDGIEMAKIIKNVNPDQNIIFLSAYTEQRFLTKAIEIGVDGFVFKPINTETLYQTIYKSLNQILLKKENIEYKNNLERLVEERSADLRVKNRELHEMIKEVRKSNALKEEMKIAQKVQENFLPKELPQSHKLQIATFFEAAQYVGGDYYDLFYSSDNSINIIIADVSGHGVAPAITMSTFRGVCRSVFSLDMPFEKQIELINDLICEDSKHNDFFITAFFIKYYEDENKFEYISAGHNEMIFYDSLADQIYELKSTTIPLAVFPNRQYKSIHRKLNKNDFLVLYTDGLTEANNENNEMYELKRLEESVLKSKGLEANEILTNVTTSLDDFIGTKTKNDDTTVLIVKFI